MSGTSLDGVDAVLAQFDHKGHPTLLGRASVDFPPALQAEFLSLNQSGHDELARAALAANTLASLYANAVQAVLAEAGIHADQVAAIGAHGQTVRHRPELGYTLQLNAPALLAERTGISVIADFRSRDVAAGGQGAPLVPLFHAGVFAAPHTRVILNLGGIANITILRPQQAPLGFDTGPANVLMDMWSAQHTGSAFDEDGAWGALGQPDLALLEALLHSEPWLSLPGPKSTGRDLFNRNWLEQRLADFVSDRTTTERNARQGSKQASFSSQATSNGASSLDTQWAQDVQATLRRLTVVTVSQCLQRSAEDAQELLVCGGGARNGALMADLRQALGYPVRTTDEVGIHTQDVEALAFAWLAWAHQQGICTSDPTVTGARGARILGALWPA